jgi:iron complex outermembrane recepter protein
MPSTHTLAHLKRNSAFQRRKFRASVSGAAILIAGALATASSAEAQTQTAQGVAAIDEIVVTGTRVVRDGYEAPTPVTVVGVEQIESNATANIADFVNQLPTLAGSTTPMNTVGGRFSGTPGLNTLSLRNLGGDRTLVLIDGQRSVGSTPAGRVDINIIPQAVVSRVDVVTGGAASAYGSDAVTGVVNFIIDKTFTGVKGEAGYGMTDYGDGDNWKTSLTVGTRFAGDRGHILISGEMADSAFTQFGRRRSWANTGALVLENPEYTATNGQPFYILRRESSIALIAPGGIITAGPLKGVAFNPDGTPFQWNYGFYGASTRNFQIGGDWNANHVIPFATLDGGVERKSVFLRTSYDLTDNVTVFAQWNWAVADTLNVSNFKNDQNNITISVENAFLPETVRARMVASGLTSFVMGSQLRDFGFNYSFYNRRVNRFVVGANGAFDAVGSDWTWDAYYQRGYAMNSNRYVERVAANWTAALDSVRGSNGQIICRSTIANPTNGCVPFNPFGIGVNSQNVIDYIQTINFNRWNYTQEVMAANVNGTPFSTWSGPVSLAFGAEHRTEAGDGRPMNDDTLFKRHIGGNTAPFDGSYNVTEGYVETVVPLAANTEWATALDLNAAVRATSYSTSGYVTTWKVGVSYSPIDDIRFRATRSRDIRAPNRQELFTDREEVNNFISDPFNGGRIDRYISVGGGNLNLKPEKGDAWGLGVVLQPTFFPGFNASIDYYTIEIKDAIGSIGSQQTIDQCFAGVTSLCPNVIRLPDGHVAEILSVPSNFVSVKSSGMDFEASYSFSMDEIVSSWAGDVNLRVLAAHAIELTSNNGITAPANSAGTNAGSGPPSWRWTSNISYRLDAFRAALTFRGLSSGTYSNRWIVCTTGCPTSTVDNRTSDQNHIDGAMYFDTSFGYRVFGDDSSSSNVELYLNVKNIFNKDPPVAASTPGSIAFYTPPDNPNLYDRSGRAYQAGIRFKM